MDARHIAVGTLALGALAGYLGRKWPTLGMIGFISFAASYTIASVAGERHPWIGWSATIIMVFTTAMIIAGAIFEKKTVSKFVYRDQDSDRCEDHHMPKPNIPGPTPDAVVDRKLAESHIVKTLTTICTMATADVRKRLEDLPSDEIDRLRGSLDAIVGRSSEAP